MEYRTIRELCELVVDCPHSTPTWTNCGKIVIRNQYIKNGRIDFSAPSYTNEEHFLQRIKRAKPKYGDIIITREAPIGDVGMIPEGIECCLGQRMVLLRANPKICDKYYLLYCLQSRYVQHQISWSEGTGTTVSNLRIPHLEQLKIPYPPMETQRKIASILRSIEEKMGTNRKINDNLQQQAMALFHAYFPYAPTDDVPTDWRICALSDVTENIRTRVKNQNCTVLSAVNAGKLQPSEEYFTKQVFSKDISNYIVVEENSFAYNPARVNIGSIGINNLGFLGCVSPVYVVFRVEEDYQYFFDFFIKTPRFREEVRTRASGSVRQAMNYSDFGLIPIAYPPKSVIDNFNRLYLPIYRHIEHRKEENTRLAELRDNLLPRLMSGEIDVSDIQI